LNRRLAILLYVLLGLTFLAVLELFLFTRLGPLRAIFLQVAYLGVLTALGTVLARNLVHAALFLVGFFFLVACLFVLLEAEFLAAMQVLVYIGAIAILMMFGIMLTRNIQGDDTTMGGSPLGRLPAVIAAAALLGITIFGIAQQRSSNPRRTWSNLTVRAPVRDAEGRALPRGQVIDNMSHHLGNELMTRWVIPFEVAGLMLTAAVVGAIALARFDEETEPTPASQSRASAGTPTDQPSPAASLGPEPEAALSTSQSHAT
jgi:NADH-quinone oxidoreductase subunit J